MLVILGLLTGGVLTGQSLIRAAELRSISTDFTKYTAAVHTFRDKYFALPGDMRNAVRFWGAQAGGTADGVDATCKALTEASPATGTATCNGDGDGQVDYYAADNQFETFRFWQHLANAGLIEGSYSGVYGSAGATYKALVGVNVPSSKISTSGFSIRDLSIAPAADTESFQVNQQGGMIFGKQCVGNCTLTQPAIKPEEAWNIDTKMDDGKPATGKILAQGVTACTTASGNTDLTGDYDLAVTTIACGLIQVHSF